MPKLKKGFFMNDTCIGCDDCVSMCKIPDCIIQKNFNGKKIISTNPVNCIKCGMCMQVCKQDAIDYTDDTQRFLEDLKSGRKISIAVDPALYFDYPDKASAILAYLKKIGVTAIYNVSFGNDLSIWTYAHWLRMHPKQKAIISQCPSSIEYIRKFHPDLLKNLAPVRTGLMCLAIYVRKYLKEKRRIAYISPCVSTGDQIRLQENRGLVQYNVTFKHLLNEIGKELPHEGSYEPVKPDLDDYGFGSLLPVYGNMRRILEYYIGIERPFIEVPEIISLFSKLQNFKTKTETSKPIIGIVTNCVLGCTFGTGVDSKNILPADVFSMSSKKRKDVLQSQDFVHDINTPDKQLEKLDKHFSGININDFLILYTERYSDPAVIPEDVYNEIFNKMHKTTEASRKIDCQLCGYETCRDMVTAIAKGYNQIENCVQYEKEKVTRLLTTDSTTHLPNMQIFYKTLDTMLAENSLKGISVIRLHFNGLLLINQLFGFEIGTKALIEFAQITKSHLYAQEGLFQNSGPDFYAILKNEHVNQFVFSISHLSLPSVSKLAPDFSGLTVNCGIYILTGNETKIDDIVNNVTSAYRLTKNNDASRIVYYDNSMTEIMLNSLATAQRIPLAIENKEFSVMFQPKVSANKHILVGAEALIRWTHNGKTISPNEFIGVAETSGHIKQIDFIMLTEVCKHISMWNKIGMKSVRVSVNFSKANFTKSDIVERICGIIDTFNVPHNCIEIEITESSFVNEVGKIKEAIIKLKENDIMVAIDDFGTGYSSISLLSELPFDVVKFDKTIIDTLQNGLRAKMVIHNIINMAKDLKMEVVAEGIDTQEKLSVLESLGCDMIQGYIFDKPLTPQDFLKKLAHPKY